MLPKTGITTFINGETENDTIKTDVSRSITFQQSNTNQQRV